MTEVNETEVNKSLTAMPAIPVLTDEEIARIENEWKIEYKKGDDARDYLQRLKFATELRIKDKCEKSILNRKNELEQ